VATTNVDAGEREERTLPGAERERDLRAIDALVDRCKDRLSGVSDKLLSSATKSALVDDYRSLREEAENDELRTERLQWMRDNVSLLQETIVKAASQRERFEADLEEAVAKKWTNAAGAERWMRRFEDPSLLEMYRSAWLRDEWPGFKERWKAVATDRARGLESAAAQGLAAKDVPELAVLAKDDRFLSDALSYHERRSLVDAADAAITAAGTGKTVELRKTEQVIAPASKGADRYLHPGKVGQWLQRAAKSGDPAAFRENVIKPFMKNWRAARTRYDALAKRYAADGRPDGCAPMGLNAFLEGSYDARLAALEEWENRLDAAARADTAETEGFEREKLEIRRSIDLHDLDVAETKLTGLRAAHPDDKDLVSIAAHVAALRAEVAEKDAEETDARGRTTIALDELRAMKKGVPSALSKMYEHLLKEGDADAAATFFLAMKVRADRRKAGETTDREEYLATLKAGEAVDAALVDAGPVEPDDADAAPAAGNLPSPVDDPRREPPAPRDDAPDDAELIVTKDTPPSETLSLLRSHGGARTHRSPALVVEGMPFEQQLQLVELNARALAHMRHLDSVGEPYETAEALAA
jgi:hypothetical protein